LSPTHQDLSNDTTFSQIKSRVPVPLNNSEQKSKTQDIYIHLISIFILYYHLYIYFKERHQEVYVNILFSPKIIKKMKIIGKVFLLDMKYSSLVSLLLLNWNMFLCPAGLHSVPFEFMRIFMLPLRCRDYMAYFSQGSDISYNPCW